MHLHLHHAVSAATSAIAELSGISFYNKECNAPDLEAQSIARVRTLLAQAAAELNAYDAKREQEKQGAKCQS